MRLPWGLLACLLALPGCVSPGGSGPGDDEGAPVTFEAIRFETEEGAFTAILFPAEHPETTAFMRKLVEDKYYEGREFGRVIPGFVIQEVDRTGGTTDQKETVPLEAGTAVQFSAGAIGIARDVDPNSGGSEFFVMDFAVSPLWGNYTAWAQVVDGMDVVHKIARAPAVKTGPASAVSSGLVPGSPVYFGVHDRVPVDPVKMTRVTLLNVTLPAAEAARYPLRVGETYRSPVPTDAAGTADPRAAPQIRATLEWPANLDAGRASALTWYVATREVNPATSQARDPPSPDLAGVTVRVEGPGAATIPVQEDAGVPGMLRFSWTPAARGSYVLHLEKDGKEVALSNVTVPTPPPHLDVVPPP